MIGTFNLKVSSLVERFEFEIFDKNLQHFFLQPIDDLLTELTDSIWLKFMVSKWISLVDPVLNELLSKNGSLCNIVYVIAFVVHQVELSKFLLVVLHVALGFEGQILKDWLDLFE